MEKIIQVPRRPIQIGSRLICPIRSSKTGKLFLQAIVDALFSQMDLSCMFKMEKGLKLGKTEENTLVLGLMVGHKVEEPTFTPMVTFTEGILKMTKLTAMVNILIKTE